MADDLIKKLEYVKPDEFYNSTLEVLRQIKEEVDEEKKFYFDLYIRNVLRKLEKI